MMTNQEFHLKLKGLFEIETYNGIEGYKSFKIERVESQQKSGRSHCAKKKKNKVIIMKEIEQTRKIVRWEESANLKEEKGNKIKRRRRGKELIRKSKPRKWLGKETEEVIDLR